MATEVYIVNRPNVLDGTHVFTDEQNADRFAAACEWAGIEVERDTLPLIDDEGTERLVADVNPDLPPEDDA